MNIAIGLMSTVEKFASTHDASTFADVHGSWIFTGDEEVAKQYVADLVAEAGDDDTIYVNLNNIEGHGDTIDDIVESMATEGAAGPMLEGNYTNYEIYYITEELALENIVYVLD